MVTSICVAKAGDLASGYQSVPQEAMCLAAIVSVISGEVCTMKYAGLSCDFLTTVSVCMLN